MKDRRETKTIYIHTTETELRETNFTLFIILFYFIYARERSAKATGKVGKTVGLAPRRSSRIVSVYNIYVRVCVCVCVCVYYIYLY